MTSIAIEGGWVVTGVASQPDIQDGHVLIRDGLIVSVGAGRSPEAAERTINADGMIVMPGFVNAHTHLCMTLGRTLGADASLLQWLTEAQVPLMSAFEPEDYALATALGALENLKAGNTTVAEVFFSHRLPDGADQLAVGEIDRLGLRGLFFRCSNDLPFAPGFVEELDDIERRTRELMAAWDANPRIQVGAGPLVPWTATRDYWAQTSAMAGEGTRIHLHTAETPEYNDLVRQRFGLSNVELLADVDVLGPNVMLNHCIHVSDRDIALIAERGAAVVHDPTSNMFLASGVAPLRAFREQNVRLGLACDGPACNNTQDMFEVMKNAALLQKVTHNDAGALTAREVFAMATSGGADACGLGDVTGRLASGFAADIVLVDARKPHLTPIHDPVAAIVYSANAADVDTVIVDGKVVMEGRTVPGIDERHILAHAQERAVALRSAANI